LDSDAVGCEDRPWIDIATGDYLTCGVHDDGCGECWGREYRPRTDSGFEDNRDASVPTDVWSEIELPWYLFGPDEGHACGLGEEGLRCWGLEQGDEMSGPAGEFEDIALGYQSTCGLQSDGGLQCWGTGPAPPDGNFRKLTGGTGHCALTAEGEAVCWGAWGVTTFPEAGVEDIAQDDDALWIVADGRAERWWVFTGTRTMAGRSALQIDDYGSDLCWGCYIRTDGTLSCASAGASRRPAPDGTFTQLSCGWNHTCALRTDGHILCWGSVDDNPEAWKSYEVPGSYGG